MKQDDVRRTIRFKIASGEYAPGDAIPSERALAEQLQVSRVTVRAALRSLIEKGLLKSCGRGGTVVCRKPDLKLTARSGDKVLFLFFSSIPELRIDRDGIAGEIYCGFEKCFRNSGFQVIFQNGEDFLKNGLSPQVCGVIASGRELDKNIPEIAGCGVPVVAAVTSVELPCDSVGWSDFATGSCAVQCAVRRGAHKILITAVSYDGEVHLQSSFRRRIAGVMDECAIKGVSAELLVVPYIMCSDPEALAEFIHKEYVARGCDFLVDCSRLPLSAYEKLPSAAIDAAQPCGGELRDAIFCDAVRVGFLAGDRLMQRMKNPCLSHIHIDLPTKIFYHTIMK